MDCMTGPFLLSISVFWFWFSSLLCFFGSVRQIKLATRQLLRARKHSLWYRDPIVVDNMSACFPDVGGRLHQLRLQPGALRQPVLLLSVHVVAVGRQHGRSVVDADLSAATSATLHSRCVCHVTFSTVHTVI